MTGSLVLTTRRRAECFSRASRSCLALLLLCACLHPPPDAEPEHHRRRRDERAEQPRPAHRDRRRLGKAAQLIFNNLMTLDDHLRVVPDLAERLDNPDPTTYVATLRRGVRFHDGHELTSADVVFTFRSLLDPAFLSPRKGAYRMVDGVEARDRYTVVFIAEGAVRIVSGQPGDPDRARRRGRDLSRASDRHRAVPVRPLRGRRSARARAVRRLLRRPAQERRPRSCRSFPTTSCAASSSARARWTSSSTTSRRTSSISSGRDPALQVVESPGTDYQYIGPEPARSAAAGSAGSPGAGLRDRSPGDHRVPAARSGRRRPPACCRRSPGRSSRTSSRSPTIRPGRARCSTRPAIRTPTATARAALQLSLKVSNIEFNRLQSSVIQQNLRAVGIALDVRTYEFATLYADVLKGNFQLFTLQWVGGAVADPDILRRVFHSSQMPPAGFNRGLLPRSARRSAARRGDRRRPTR